MIHAFEMILCYWAWLKKDEYWECNDMEALQEAKVSINTAIQGLKRLFPRSTGSQWNIPKFHEQLHMAYNIHLFGSHQNVHTGPQEHNHIENAKKPSKRTQQRKGVFDWQIGNRLVDKYVINYTHNKIAFQQKRLDQFEELVEDATKKTSTKQASKFDVYMKRDFHTNDVKIDAGWSTDTLKNKDVCKDLLLELAKHYFYSYSRGHQYEGIHIECCTEYCRENVVFRCHPNFRDLGEWYDYALIAWNRPAIKSKYRNDTIQEHLDEPVMNEDEEETDDVDLVPAKLMCFVTTPDKQMYALIHSCQTRSKKASVLTYQWRLEYEEDSEKKDHPSEPHNMKDDATKWTPSYRSVSVDTLQKHCLMIPCHENSKFVLQVIEQNKWAASFSNI